MNRDTIAQEIPEAMCTWMHAHADDDLWERIGRAVARDLGRRLLVGDPGTNPLLLTVHLTGASPAMRHVATVLGSGRRWSAFRVTRALIEYLGLYSAQYQVERSLGKPHGAEADEAA
jgi:hypothetical protein